MEIRSSFETNTTVIANAFIDQYMASASGEYVKVYLYILRHAQEPLNEEMIAEALNHTEADVRRAVAYWEKAGVLSVSRGEENEPKRAGRAERPAASVVTGAPGVPVPYPGPESSRGAGQTGKAPARTPYSADQITRLSSDEEFAQLLYIAQKYMNRMFTQRDLEVMAYLYDGLHMNAELLEYLIEHCVQGGHTSMRYVETVALSWHEKGFATAEEARAYAESFTKNSFSVMKAFGLTDRKPGDKEKEMIERWFGSYGFTRELVLEACSRTLTATHAPSFQYADKILSGWRNAGVRTMKDVAALDEQHQTRARTTPARKPAKAPNQFHNFEQRATNYDDTVLDDMRAWMGKPEQP